MIVGDGELNEGQCWEAFQYIAHFKLNHCIVIIDDNKKQLDGPTKDILDPFDIQQKMTAFGFYTEKVPGADMQAIDEYLEAGLQDVLARTVRATVVECRPDYTGAIHTCCTLI